MNVVVNNIYVRRTLKVRVVRDDGAAPYETKYKHLFELGSVPDRGDTFSVVVDPGRPGRIAVAKGAPVRDRVRLPSARPLRDRHRDPVHELAHGRHAAGAAGERLRGGP
jgi:hypothetical protein